MSTSKEAAKQDKKVDKQNEMDFDALLKAIKEHLIENKPLRAAARDNGTSRTTLSRYSEKIKKEFEDLSAVTDEELMNYIRKRNMHLPCTMVSVIYKAIPGMRHMNFSYCKTIMAVSKLRF